MGAVYSLCFGHGRGNSRAGDYKVDEENAEAGKVYSWDKRAALDPRQFTFDGLRGRVVAKPPGSVSGQQFIVSSCQNCVLALLDHSASVTVDDCVECTILIGPCKGSVFLRNCIGCRVMAACQQYRVRDCKNVDTYLLCQTQPIIESSAEMRFACLQLDYDRFEEHLDCANLSPFNNSWSKIHDFTPTETSRNYSYLPETSDQLETVGAEALEELRAYGLRSTRGSSCIPLTLGKRARPSEETCFCLLFPKDERTSAFRRRCLDVIKRVLEETPARLVATAEVRATAADLERLAGVKDVAEDATVVAMEWSGPKVADVCDAYCRDDRVSIGAYVATGQRAVAQSKEFYKFVDMQHGV